jgi:hypothetical protein
MKVKMVLYTFWGDHFKSVIVENGETPIVSDIAPAILRIRELSAQKSLLHQLPAVQTSVLLKA